MYFDLIVSWGLHRLNYNKLKQIIAHTICLCSIYTVLLSCYAILFVVTSSWCAHYNTLLVPYVNIFECIFCIVSN